MVVPILPTATQANRKKSRSKGLFVSCLYWLLFAVGFALFHLWASLLAYVIQGKPPPTESIVNGSLLVFSIVTLATSFGDFFRLTGFKRQSMTAFLSVAGALAGISAATIVYCLSVLAVDPALSEPSCLLLNVFIAAFSVIYGFASFMVTHKHGN